MRKKLSLLHHENYKALNLVNNKARARISIIHLRCINSNTERKMHTSVHSTVKSLKKNATEIRKKTEDTSI